MAFPITIPHFNLPFRFVNNSGVDVVEQDTLDDIANCVEVILRTPYGYRTQDNTPEFGTLDPVFELTPVDIETVKSTIIDQEPRATILITEDLDRTDSMIENIRVEVS